MNAYLHTGCKKDGSYSANDIWKGVRKIIIALCNCVSIGIHVIIFRLMMYLHHETLHTWLTQLVNFFYTWTMDLKRQHREYNSFTVLSAYMYTHTQTHTDHCSGLMSVFKEE